MAVNHKLLTIIINCIASCGVVPNQGAAVP